MNGGAGGGSGSRGPSGSGSGSGSRAPTAVLGVDSSTSACKVEIRRLDDGELLGSGQAPHPATVPPRSEQDPDAWWRALVHAVGAARADAGDVTVAAIAVAGQQHGLVALDTDGEVLRPAKLWNDTESAPDADWLVEQLDPAAWATTCGSVPVASFTITKLSWLHRREPEVWDRLGTVLLPHDWLTWRLTGRRITDRGDASGTGYWSPSTGDYCWDLLAIVDDARDWSEVVPEVLGPTDVVGPLTPDAAAPLGVAEATLVTGGTGDNMAAALGLGLRPGDLAISIGTSGTVFAVSDDPTADPTGAVAGFADAAGRFLPLVCTLNATQVTDATARWLGLDRDRLAARAIAVEAGSGGVTFVPYLAGERTPNRPDATGEIVGLRVDTTPEQLARAAHEGVVCGLLDGVDALTAAGVKIDDGRLLVLGGGSRSLAYPQILADLAQQPVAVVEEGEHVATGACVQAAAGVEHVPIDAVQSAWSVGRARIVQPSSDGAQIDVRERYRDIRDR